MGEEVFCTPFPVHRQRFVHEFARIRTNERNELTRQPLKVYEYIHAHQPDLQSVFYGSLPLVVAHSGQGKGVRIAY
jgi:hypothetical protein